MSKLIIFQRKKVVLLPKDVLFVGKTGKDEMENRKWGVQCAEKIWVQPGASVQQELPGIEKPLLPAANRAYDKPVYGGVGKGMEEGEAEFRAATQETTGIYKGNATGRM